VSESVAVLSILGTDRWNTDVYGSLTAASEVSSALKNGALRIRLAYLLQVLNRRLKHFFEELYNAVDHPNPVAPEQTPSVEDIQQAISALRQLSTSLSNTYDRAKRVRLTNNSLLGGALGRLHIYSEDLSEVAEWLEMLLEPNSYENAFKRAADEKEQGQVFNLSQVQ
jgi:glycyl-tRNA synthetase beta subunit